MKRGRIRASFGWMLLLALILGVVTPAFSQGPEVGTASDAALAKIKGEALRNAAAAGGDEALAVVVYAAPDLDLSAYMNAGARRIPRGGVRIVTGTATPQQIIKIASLATVYEIRAPADVGLMKAVSPDASRPEPSLADALQKPRLQLEKPAAANFAEPAQTSAIESFIGVDVMGASAAWAKGYTGEGVIVGQVDSGADFGHPDLEGTWAVATEPRYAGWPMVYDQLSAEIYASTGYAWNTRAFQSGTPGAYSNYIDTSTVVTTTHPGDLAFRYAVPCYSGTGACTNRYTFDGPPSVSGEYRVGSHPDMMFAYTLGPSADYPAVLLVDEQVSGVYDVLYVDMDYSYSFDPYERFTFDNPTGWYWDDDSGSWSRDWTGDGVADISAGIMYWIADGTHPIPGTDVIYETPPVPGNGDMVLFFGDYDGNSHGTGTGSAVAGQGVINSPVGTGNVVQPWADVSGGVVFGTAPDAKLFSSPLAGVAEDAWTVQALGYDGEYGTVDDAQIDTNSWGYFYLEDGWDLASRFVTWMNYNLAPDTLWLSGTANGGYGYGTAASSGSASTALAVGGVNLHSSDDTNEIIASIDQLLYGDLTPFSSRGPTATGGIGTNVTSIADGATGDAPLMLAIYYNSVVDGQRAWWGFGGTSQATPFVAGIAALVYDAYKDATGVWPDFQTARELLMASADDMHNDPFAQGAGRANADRATDVAGGLEGIYVSPPEWEAGDFRGETYPSFAHLMKPGDTSTQEFTVHNQGTEAVDVTVSDDVLLKTKTLTYELTAVAEDEDPFYGLRPDYMIDIPLEEIPEDTALMRVFMSIPYEQFSLGDPTVPSQMAIDGLFYLRVYNWTDLDDDGVLWTDLDGNGAVNNGELDNPPVGYPNTSQEFNSFGISYQYDPAHEMRVEQPLERVDDGLLIGLHHYQSASREIDRDVPETQITVNVEFYEHSDWSLLAEAPTDIQVPAGGAATFEATATVPADQEPGLYEGAIWVDDGQHITVVPVVINVAPILAADDLSFEFGGLGHEDLLYDNGKVLGGQDWLGNGWADQGDWRFFFVDVPDDLGEWAGGKWLVETIWDTFPTDIDTLIYGPEPATAPYDETEIFGPYTLAPIGGSESTIFAYDSLFPYGRYAYTFQTATGETRELVSADLTSGLTGIWLHNVLYGGLPDGEAFQGQAGTVALLPNPNEITTASTVGTEELTLKSSMLLDDFVVNAFGLNQPIVFENEFIDSGTGTYEWAYTFDLVNAVSLAVTLSSPDIPDLDLVLEWWDGSEWVPIGSSAGATADEYIEASWPADGMYQIGIDNYTNIPGHFDLSIDIVAGDDMWVTDVPEGPILPGEVYTMTLHWDKDMIPGQDYYGVILAGPPAAPHAIRLDKTIHFGTAELRYYLPLVLRGYVAP